MTIPTQTGDPVSFDTYLGQEKAKRRLQLRLNAMSIGDSLKALFFAPPGQGKTALVRVIAYEMIKRGLAKYYVETIAGKFETKKDLDSFIKRIPAYSIVFIDEIHGLTGPVRDALYPAIQDGIYMYDDKVSAVPLPTGIHWFGATTDLGKIHQALQRRLIPIPLEPLSLEDRFWLAMKLPRKVEDSAAMTMAERCWSPWEIKDELYLTAGDIASENKSWEIKLEHVLEACGLLGVDKNGLRPKDRLILEYLHKNPRVIKGETVYTLPQKALTVMAGIDNQTFNDSIEPKLLRLGYITTRSGVGRILTEKGINDYFNEQK
jgi:Holliday junction resolvasome RuvABC ATP-dependent DNA helicase subunit